MQFLTSVLVLTSSLLDALQTTLRILVLRVTASDAQLKLPSLSLRALNLQLPPRTLTLLILAASGTSLVLETGLAFQKALFFLWIGILPPVSLLLCLESLLIPIHLYGNFNIQQILFNLIYTFCTVKYSGIRKKRGEEGWELKKEGWLRGQRFLGKIRVVRLQIIEFNLPFLLPFSSISYPFSLHLTIFIKLLPYLQQIAMRQIKDGLPSTFKPLTKVHTGPIYTLKFNRDGEYCMTGSQDRSVCLYNPSKNIMIKNYKNIHNYDVYSLDISKDNSKFITGGGDKNIILTDVVEGKYIRKYTGHTARINSVCFNQDNNVIISASYDTSVRFWDNRNDAYHPIQIIKGFKDSVSQVRAHGTQIMCASMDGSVKTFDIRRGEVVIDQLSEAVQRFDVANSRKAYVASGTNSKLYLIEKSTGIKIQEYSGHHIGQFTVDAVFNSKDTHIFTGSAEGKLYVYDIMKKTPVKEIAAHEKVLSAIDLHDSGVMVTASHDGSVNYWKL